MNIQKSAELSQCGLYRWTLHRSWIKPGALQKMVCWIMMNPSTADAQKDDPTTRMIQGITTRWGYNSLVVVNLFPFRSSSPYECCKHFENSWTVKSDAADALQYNKKIIVKTVAVADLIVAAWGNLSYPHWHKWSREIMNAVHQSSPVLHCLGKNASGEPKHPLSRGDHRIPDDIQPQLFSKV